ncbi:MAG TPA: hypothetical protein VGL20_07740 [Candidatus Dormibacteraeota bacterium]
MTRALTLRLDDDDHDRLEREASRLGLRAGTLARVYVRAGLGDDPAAVEAALRRRAGTEALARLAKLREELRTAGHVGVDAVATVNAARGELDERRAG